MGVLSFREVENKERKGRDEGDVYVLKAKHFVKNIDTLNNSGFETLILSKLNKDKKKYTMHSVHKKYIFGLVQNNNDFENKNVTWIIW